MDYYVSFSASDMTALQIKLNEFFQSDLLKNRVDIQETHVLCDPTKFTYHALVRYKMINKIS